MSRTAQLLRPLGETPNIPPVFVPLFAQWLNTDEAEPGFLVDENADSALTPIVQPGRCLLFDGANDIVDIDLNGWTPDYPFSFCLWMNTSSVAATKTVFSFGDDGAANEYVELRQLVTTGELRVNRRNAGADVASDTGFNITTDVWRHVTVVCDNDQTVRVYVDGFRVYNNEALTAVALNASYDDCNIANRVGTTTCFPGKISDVRLYERVLTPEEVRQIYNSTKLPGRSPADYYFDDDLVGHWTLADFTLEASGATSNVYDRSANANHGLLLPAATIAAYNGNDVPFSHENEVRWNNRWSPYLDSAANRRISADEPRVNGPSVTVAAWMRTTVGSGIITVVSQFDNGLSQAAWRLQLDAGKLRVRLSDDGTSVTKDYSTVATYSDGAWHHLAFTWGSGTLKLYVDGVLIGSPTLTADNSMTNIFASTEPIRIGAHASSGAVAGYFTGSIVEVYGFNRELTAPEIASLHSGDDVATTSLEGYWKANESSGNPVEDWSGNNNHARSRGNSTARIRTNRPVYESHDGKAAYRAILKDSPCVTLDGTNDYGVTSDFLSGGSALTVSVWVYATSATGTIVAHSDIAASQRSWSISDESSNLRVVVAADGVGAAVKSYLSNGTLLPTGQWIHVAFTFASNDLRLYINGVRADVTKTTDNTVNSLHDSTASITLGSRDPSSPTAFHECRVADVRVYEATLTKADIWNIYKGNDIATNPVAWWPCSEGGGLTLHDATGNGHNMATSGATAAQLWANVQPVYHHSLRHGFRASRAGRTFNGSSHFFQQATPRDVPYRIGTTVGSSANHFPFWAAVRFKPANVSGLKGLFTKWSASVREWLLYLDGNQVKGFVSSDGSTAQGNVTASGTVNVNRSFLAFFYHDPDTNVTAAAIDGAAFTTTAHNLGIFCGNEPVRIGAYNGAMQLFAGEMRLAAFGKPPSVPGSWTAIRNAIWNSGSPLQYSDLSEAQKTDWGLVSWHDFADHGNTLVDSHSSGRHFFTGSGSDFNDWRTPQAPELLVRPSQAAFPPGITRDDEFIKFNGTSHYYEGPPGDVAFTSNHTNFFAVVWLQDHVAPTQDGTIIGQWGSLAGADKSWVIRNLFATGHVQFGVSSNGTLSLTHSIVLPAGAKMAMVYHDADNDVIAVAVDDGAFSLSGSHTGGVSPETTDLTIGMHRDTGSVTGLYQGKIRFAVTGFPTGTPDWAAIQDAFWNSGVGINWDDISGDASLGLTSAFFADEVQPHGRWEDRVNGLLVEGSGTPSITTHPAGTHHNQAATDLDFTSGVASPLVGSAYPGYYTCDGTIDGVNVAALVDAQTGDEITVYARVRNIPVSTTVNWFSCDDGADGNRILTGVDSFGQIYLFTDMQYDFGAYAPYRDGGWHDIVITVDSTGTGRCYVNGTQFGSDESLGLGVDWANWTRARLLSLYNGSTFRFSGSIARLVICNAILSPTEVTGNAPSNTVVDVRFDNDKIEDEQSRFLPARSQTGRAVVANTISSDYTFGDVVSGEVVQKAYVTTPATQEENYRLVDYDE